MTNKKFTILGIIAAVMIVLVLVQSGTNKTTAVDNDSIKYLIQGLDTTSLKSIEIISGDEEEEVTLIKGDAGFKVKELSGYPAKVSEINNLITKCLDIEVGKIYTSKADNFTDLGVADDNAKTIVKFKDDDGKVVTGVVVSENKEGKTYVRRVDSEDVYAAQGGVWLNGSADNYVDKQIGDVAKDKITEVTVNTDGKQYRLVQNGGKAQLQGVPQGKVAKQTECDAVVGAITSLQFDDVKSSIDVNGLNFDSSYECKLNDSTIYTVKLAKKDDKTYATFSATFTDTAPVTKDKGVESEEELKKKETKLLANEASNKYGKRHSGWIYVLPSSSADNLMKAFDSLVEDAPAPEPTPQAAVGPIAN